MLTAEFLAVTVVDARKAKPVDVAALAAKASVFRMGASLEGLA